MKLITSILFVLFLSVLSCAQYTSNVLGYNVYVYRVDFEPDPDYVMQVGEQGFDLRWQRGTGDGYLIPETWIEEYKYWIQNEEGLWDADTAKTDSNRIVVSMTQGWYAVTITEVIEENWESGKAIPFYIEAKENYARVPINFFRKD